MCSRSASAAADSPDNVWTVVSSVWACLNRGAIALGRARRALSGASIRHTTRAGSFGRAVLVEGACVDAERPIDRTLEIGRRADPRRDTPASAASYVAICAPIPIDP